MDDEDVTYTKRVSLSYDDCTKISAGLSLLVRKMLDHPTAPLPATRMTHEGETNEAEVLAHWYRLILQDWSSSDDPPTRPSFDEEFGRSEK